MTELTLNPHPFRIICTRPDGGVSVICPAPNARGLDEDEMDFVNRIAAKDGVGKGLTVRRILPTPDLIGSRYFRDIWEWDNIERKIVVSLVKARAQRLAEIRAMRNQLLVGTDGEYARLSEVGTVKQKSDLAAVRATLRDVPTEATLALDVLTTLDEVMNYEPTTWPEATDSRRSAFVDGQLFGTNKGAEAP